MAHGTCCSHHYMSGCTWSNACKSHQGRGWRRPETPLAPAELCSLGREPRVGPGKVGQAQRQWVSLPLMPVIRAQPLATPRKGIVPRKGLAAVY